MIEVRLDAASMARVRFAPSPAYEIVSWLGLTGTGRRHPLLGDPGPAARFALRDRRVATAAALAAPGASGLYMPDFLTPKPAVMRAEPAGPDDQLERIGQSDPAEVHAQVAMMPWRSTAMDTSIRRAAESGTLAESVAAGLSLFWTAAVADGWPRMHRAIRREVVRQTSRMLVGGTGAVLNGLHRTVRLRGATMCIDKPHDAVIEFRDAELAIVPSVLGPPRLAAQVWDPQDAMLFYPVAPAPEGDHTLNAEEALLGAGRAAVLAALATPSATTELRAVLGLSASTISHHLRVLTDAGLATSTRVGRFVIYRQTPEAGLLLETLRTRRPN